MMRPWPFKLSKRQCTCVGSAEAQICVTYNDAVYISSEMTCVGVIAWLVEAEPTCRASDK